MGVAVKKDIVQYGAFYWNSSEKTKTEVSQLSSGGFLTDPVT